MKISIALCALLLVAVEMFISPVFAQRLDRDRTGESGKTALEERDKGGTIVTVKDNGGSAFENPSSDAGITFSLKKGEILSVIRAEGDWYLVESRDGKIGWAQQSLFFPSEKTQPAIESMSGRESPSNTSEESQQGSSPPETDSLRSQMDMQPADDKQLLTLNYLNVDIREALSALAIEREISIATSQDVSGNISVHLYQVSLGEALDAISMAGGCKYRKDGNLYYVYKPEDDIDPQAAEYEVRVFELQYTEIDQIQEILDSFTDVHLLKIHEPSRTIIIEDTPRNIEKIEAVIDHWDKKPKQALIEVEILEIVLTDAMSFGVDWEQILGDVRIGTGGFSTAVPPADPDVSPVPSTGVGMFANALTAAGTGHQFAAALDTLQTMTEINVLSTPKLLAVHDKAARVQVGGEQGYRVTTSNLGVTSETIEFIDTGIILDLTPYYDDEGNALLEVQPSISTVRLEEGIPVVNTTVVTTWVFAKNGESIFIGGLIQERKTKTREGIPYLSRIPLLGTLFGRTGRSIGKSEFVVIMTPHVIYSEIERANQNARRTTTEAEQEF